MPIDALAALMATGFFANTESTCPLATSISERMPSRPFTSIVVCERSRNASAPTTTTAWLSRPVAMRSPRPTGVPTRAALPLTLAVPSSRFTPGGRSPLASARLTAAAAPPQATLVVALLRPWIGKEDVDRRERTRGHHVAHHLDRVVLHDADIGDRALLDLLQKASDSGRVHLDREVIDGGIGGRDLGGGFAHAEPHLRHDGRIASERRAPVE